MVAMVALRNTPEVLAAGVVSAGQSGHVADVMMLFPSAASGVVEDPAPK